MIFTNNFPEARSSFQAAIEKSLEAIGLQAAGYAQEDAPVDTSALKNSLTHSVGDKEVAVGTNIEYAIYQEMGTYKMSPHPYLKPAVSDHTAEYKGIVEAAMKAG